MDNNCDGQTDEGFDNVAETCDQEDNDCDGQTDEDFLLLTEICDDIDNNCDGQTDEGFSGITEICDGLDNNCNDIVDDIPGLDLTAPESCGLCSHNCFQEVLNVPADAVTCTVTVPGLAGTCGSVACALNYQDLDGDGSCETFCVQVASDDARCDQLDDDCDGLTDEDVDLCTSTENCGACNNRCAATHGTAECIHTGDPSSCTVADTQCAITSCECTGPGNCWHDVDGSHATGCEYACDLTNGGVEICDGLDNDCDGLVDVADDLAGDARLSLPCAGDPDGVCAEPTRQGVTSCQGGVIVCTGPNALRENQQPELCNNLDDDCDGVTDEQPVDQGGACGSNNRFPCAYGVNQCQNGQLVCVGAVEPRQEICNGVDDDCDGDTDLAAGEPPPEAVGPCNVPVPPPPGADTVCQAGYLACVGGSVACVNSIAAQSTTDTCGVDANCDGQLTNQPNLNTDVRNCGSCGNDCLAGAVHANWACVNGGCQFQGCQNGYYDNGGPGDAVAGDNKCGYACTFTSAQERCNGVDDDCDGQVDEGVTPPSPAQACGVHPQASSSECTTLVTVECVNGGWRCTFPSGVCNPNCAAAADICGDGLDNNCNAIVEECGGPTAEVCDGCDNDNNGVADDGAAQTAVACGLSGPGEPAWCTGTLACKPAQNVPPGTCVANGGFNACNISPQVESCNGQDDDCNGIVDDNVVAVPCVPAGAPPGLDYGPNSQCRQGTTVCSSGTTQCVGWVGPSAEVCDGIDNDCNGVVDNNVAGAGQSCGVNQPPCTTGFTACVNGALVCQGGTRPQPEVCDGVDNNCNGSVDEVPLADAPSPGQNGCWTNPGNCCSYPAVNPTVFWCPPPGATCNDVGTLTSPCSRGSLLCTAGGWQCVNARAPAPDQCDGVDNDCNGQPDDGNMAPVGQLCGSSVPECQQGVFQCSGGVLDCVGDIPPAPESCDGRDNDCDGNTDNGIPVGGVCTAPYDPLLYPGTRDRGACQPGALQCDPSAGTVCVGGRGPQPEVCDGVDNDCDGNVDELGAAPDGINGTVSPAGDPAAVVGEPCGVDTGECIPGVYSCQQGQVVCSGGRAPFAETCDGEDDDCDGATDNSAPNAPALCGEGSACVRANNVTRCGQPCVAGPYPCPTGQTCQDVVSPETGESLGSYCLPAP
ncbi:MAG: MopE-related protein [Myxococcota bacterium]